MDFQVSSFGRAGVPAGNGNRGDQGRTRRSFDCVKRKSSGRLLRRVWAHSGQQIAGEWRARPGSGDGKGLFLLTMNPRGNVMYGYNTAPDDNYGIVFTSWILAKNDGEKEKVTERLVWAEKQLTANTLSAS